MVMENLPVAVCGRSEVKKTAKRFLATHVFSLLDRGVPIPYAARELEHRLWIMEDTDTANEWSSPKQEQIINILETARNLPSDARLLVHCEAGVSRSTAVALAIMVQDSKDLDESARRLREIRPGASPNMLISWYADNILGLDGKLVQLAEKISEDLYKNLYGLVINKTFVPPV